VTIHIRDRVKVIKAIDDVFDERYIGCTGVVVARDVKDCGMPKHPMLIVRFDESPNGEACDGFWPEELEKTW